MKKLLLMFMMLAFALPDAIAGEKTIVINRNEGIYEDGTGAYYCTKSGITMTFSDGLDNVNYLVERNNKIFEINSTNYVIKKITFNCLDNTTEDNLDCFYWGPSTMAECTKSPYVPTGNYTYSGYNGYWTGGSTPSKSVKFETKGKPVRFGSVEIVVEKEFGDIYDLVTQSSEITNGQTYALVSKFDSRAFGKEEYHGDDPVMTFSSTPVTLLNYDSSQDNFMKVKVTDEVTLMKLESSGDGTRPWYIKIGDNYLRRRTGDMQGSGGAANGQGWNIYTVSNVPGGSESYFRTSISIGNNKNALIRFYHNSSETPNSETFAIRHYNGGDLFRVIDYNPDNNQYANNQRVYLYKPAQTYYVTTNCLPDGNSGYITLGEGALNDGNGNYTSQQYDNVNFFVGPTDGWGVGAVTVTNLSTNEVTTLTPTATNDFGNDYQFSMPAANVSITANFLSPVEIDTVCNPANGGQFNFINGYTNFNGQYYSNEGKTVTFKPSAADGYIFQSVTMTDNGVTTTMTPDANGVYSFVMPDHEVTLTANFEEAHDLYLLGTANGGGWAPTGPKFNFDGENQVYYLDVYFKGDVNTSDAYGHFSLTKKIPEPGSTNPWGDIWAYRLVAQYNDFDIWDGRTEHLYKTTDGYNDGFAFKIPAGIYRITVNPEMTEVSITQYHPTVTFTPESGTVVQSGDVVSFTSNLNDMVHAINDQEVQATYNSYDNYGVTTNDNTHTITHDDITTVTGQSKIGYITATGTADYEIIGDLYLLGTANGGYWAPTGPQFTYDADAEEYYIDVYFKGGNVDQGVDPAYGYFSLTTQVGNNWDAIKNYRLAAEYNNFGVDDGSTGVTLYSGDYYVNNAFKIPAGVYRIKVNKAKTQMSITEYPLTLTFTPPSGVVSANTQVTISSNLYDLVIGINPDEQSIVNFRNKLNDGDWDNDNTAMITAEGATTTVTAEANLDYIVVPGTAVYEVPAPTVYNITPVVTPEGAGTITAPTGAVAGETVTFTVTTNAGYQLDNVEVTYGYSQAVLDYTYDPTTGVYSFVMPDDDVKIFADYSVGNYSITTSVLPSEGGSIDVVSEAEAGETVAFTVVTNIGYALVSVTVTVDATGQEVDVNDNGDGTYSFVMPEGDVTIRAYYSHIAHHVNVIYIPQEGGTGYFYGQTTTMTYYNNYKVDFVIYCNDGYDFGSVTAVNDVTGDTIPITTLAVAPNHSFTFRMPDANVTLTVVFDRHPYKISTVHDPINGGTINLTGNAADGTEIVDQTVTFSVEEALGYSFNSVEVTIDETGEVIELTENADGTYSFVMPQADVTITAHYDEEGVIFRLVTSNEQIVEGKTYTFISQDYDRAIKHLYGKYGAISFDCSVPILEWVTPDKRRVKVGGLTAFFETKDVADTIYNSLPYKVLSLTNSGKDIVARDMPTGPLTYFLVYASPGDLSNGSLNAVAKRFIMSVNNNGSYNITSRGMDTYWRNLLGYYEEDDEFRYFVTDGTPSYMIKDVWLYKLAEPYNITTVCEPDGCGQITLSGEVSGMTALDGGNVIVTPTPVDGYALNTLTVTVDETGEEVRVVNNGDGTFSFEMPIGDVTVTAVFDVGYAISTVCVPQDGGVITVANMAEEGEIVDFTVTPYPDFTITSVVTTINGQDQTVEVSQGDNGAYSFVMPGADVTITANFERDGYILKRVTRFEEIIEGKTYTMVNVYRDKVLNKVLPDDYPPYYTSIDIVEWMTPDKTLVKVDDRACLFSFEDMTLRDNYKDAYYKTDGGYIGFTQTDDPRIGYMTLVPNKDDVKKFSTRLGDLYQSLLSFYDFENYGRNWSVYYNLEYEIFDIQKDYQTLSIYLYKIAEPYYITLKCEPEGCGTMELTSGAIGNTALEGSIVTVTPEPAQGYATSTVTVVVDDTDETFEPTLNIDGSYSFVMPSGNVTVIAHFDTGYDITTVCDPVDGGVITCRESACAGQTVQFEVTPNYSFALLGVTVTYLDENNQEVDVTVTVDDSGVYSFEMPSAAVTITASFASSYYGVTVIVNPPEGAEVEYGEDSDTHIGDLYHSGTPMWFGINDNDGYELDNYVVTIDGTDQSVPVTLDSSEDETFYLFEMPEGNVTITVNLALHTPLHFIEDQNSYIKNESEVTVTDELIGAWTAQQYVWAKDQVLSNEYFEMIDDGNVYDYVRTNLGWQTKDWDQSNWVMLDFSEIPDFNWNSTEGRQVMKKFVDHKIQAGTIKGTYYCDGNSYSPTAEFLGKTNHRIVLSELPKFIVSDETEGYPGYIPDPREEEPLVYNYNQYVAANFIQDNLLPEGVNYCIDDEEGIEYFEEKYGAYYAPLETYDHSIFFMRPKNQEVAHVWGVWAGTVTYWDYYRGNEVTKDLFETYIPNASVTPHLNTYGIPGAFAIEHWNFNRLPSPDESPVYGKPGVDGDPQDALHLNEAYLFHIAIQYDEDGHDEIPSVPVKAPGRMPVTDRDTQAPQASDYAAGFYRIYPLDLGSHGGSITSVYEVRSSTTSEIDSIRYYNVIGQESSEPFDGINIRVIRYKDGSVRSTKILK